MKKSRNNKGESLLLALVFLLFCCFVASAVLASATANARRVRSVAKQNGTVSSLRLVSSQLHGDVMLQIREQAGAVTVTLEATRVTPLQRVMVEAAILRYLQEHPGITPQYRNLSPDFLWDGSTPLTLTATENGQGLDIPPCTLAISCNEHFDFQLRGQDWIITVPAVMGTNTVSLGDETLTRTVIRWEAPRIREVEP